MVAIQGFNSSAMESWVEDGDTGGRFSLLHCVSHNPFIEQGGELPSGGEEVLSLHHIINLLLWQMHRLMYTPGPMLTSFSYEIFVIQNWLLSHRKVCAC